MNLGAKLYTTCYPQTPPSAPQVFSSGGFLKRSFFDHLGVLSCWRGPRGRPWCHEEEEKKSRRVVTKQLRRLLFFTGSMALPKDLPSCRSFLSLMKTSSFSFFLLFLNLTKNKSLQLALCHCSGYGALMSLSVGQSVDGGGRLQADSPHLEDKGRALERDGNMIFP